MRLTVCLSACSLVVVTATVARAGPEPSFLFLTRCSGCHTYGQGVRVSTDLKGVTERRSRSWLIDWIRSSEKLISTGDPVATALFREYRQVRMPDHDLPESEIAALVDFLAVGGPEADRNQGIRKAAQASVADIGRGERLFFGHEQLASGALACSACQLGRAASRGRWNVRA